MEPEPTAAGSFLFLRRDAVTVNLACSSLSSIAARKCTRRPKRGGEGWRPPHASRCRRTRSSRAATRPLVRTLRDGRIGRMRDARCDAVLCRSPAAPLPVVSAVTCARRARCPAAIAGTTTGPPWGYPPRLSVSREAMKALSSLWKLSLVAAPARAMRKAQAARSLSGQTSSTSRACIAARTRPCDRVAT